jgi:hypothetical protein
MPLYTRHKLKSGKLFFPKKQKTAPLPGLTLLRRKLHFLFFPNFPTPSK